MFFSIFTANAIKYGISVHLLMGICSVESSMRKDVIAYHDGSAGEHSYGLCQVKYGTAKMMGMKDDSRCLTNPKKCSLMRPENNIKYAAKYLKYQLSRYNGDKSKAVSAYNAGRAITKNTKYINKVMARKIFYSTIFYDGVLYAKN